MSDTLTGTTIKVQVDLKSEVSMHDMLFHCDFCTNPSHRVRVEKDDMIVTEQGEYIAIVDTTGMASGNLRIYADAQVPDSDCPGSMRRELLYVETDITIIKR